MRPVGVVMLDVGVEHACEMTGADDQERSIGTEIIRTPVRAPNANAFAERWFVRRECLDQRHTSSKDRVNLASRSRIR